MQNVNSGNLCSSCSSHRVPLPGNQELSQLEDVLQFQKCLIWNNIHAVHYNYHKYRHIFAILLHTSHYSPTVQTIFEGSHTSTCHITRCARDDIVDASLVETTRSSNVSLIDESVICIDNVHYRIGMTSW